MKELTPHTIGVVYHLGNEQLDAVRMMSEPELRLLMGQITETHVLWRECVKRLRWIKKVRKGDQWKDE